MQKNLLNAKDYLVKMEAMEKGIATDRYYHHIRRSFLESVKEDGIIQATKEVFDKVHFSRKGFGEYFIEFAYKAKKNKFKIIEVPCKYQIRPGGVSKSDGDLWTLFRLGKDYGLKVLKLRWGLEK